MPAVAILKPVSYVQRVEIPLIFLRKYLSQYEDIKEIDPADQKKIIRILVYRVVVFPDECRMDLFDVLALSGRIRKLGDMVAKG